MADDLSLIGHNNPPPHEAFAIHIGDLYEEAKHWLDGAGVNSQEEADKVSLLIESLRRARKDADAARAEEKRPHDEAAKAVQARWKPIIDQADRAAEVAKGALTPYLKRIADEQRAREEAARREAEEKARQAAEALRASTADLEAREAAEAMLDAAKDAEREASKAGRAKAHAKGGERAIGLRTYHRPVMVNAREALTHYLTTQPEAIKAILQQLAEQDVRSGKRQIPGFEVVAEERVA